MLMAHSQGTVISSQLLRENRFQQITLITMGSPLTSLYVRFLEIKCPAFPPTPQMRWLNLWRDGDYIAGPIDVAEDSNIGPGDHIFYWRDQEVAKKVLAVLGLGDGAIEMGTAHKTETSRV
jgi:hypothetical protein